MPEGPAPREFGPASKFFANLDYYETVGKVLEVEFDDIADKRLIPNGNVTASDVEETDMGVNVHLGSKIGFSVEQVTIDGEPMNEIVDWVEGGFTFVRQQQEDSRTVQADNVVIRCV